MRLAARLDATLLPFSGLGGDDSFALALDSDELLAAPGAGDFFGPRVAPLPSLVDGDVFVPPLGALTPARHYFLFGRPIETAAIRSDDRDACAAIYAELRGEVERGIEALREVREKDPYRDLARRTAWEALNGAQAPAAPEFELR